jgi:hypothetical protein
VRDLAEIEPVLQQVEERASPEASAAPRLAALGRPGLRTDTFRFEESLQRALSD